MPTIVYQEPFRLDQGGKTVLIEVLAGGVVRITPEPEEPNPPQSFDAVAGESVNIVLAPSIEGDGTCRNAELRIVKL